MERATGARVAEELIGGGYGGEANQPAGAVIAAGVEECMSVADDGAESFTERRERIERAMRLTLGTQLRQLELRLPFLATLGAAAPFIGLFGTGWDHAQLQLDRRRQQHEPGRRRPGYRRCTVRNGHGTRRGNSRSRLLQQVHRRDRPLRRGDAGADRTQWRASQPRRDGRDLSVAIPLPPSGESGEQRYVPLAEINVTPMVDVMLVLLVIFMVTAPLLTVGVPINLPKTNAAEVTQPQKPIVVSLNTAGETFIGDDKVTGDDLKAQLAALAQADPNRIVYVRGDRTIEYGKLMDLLGLVNTAGFAKVSLLAEAAKPQ